jgi:hypothetical protein
MSGMSMKSMRDANIIMEAMEDSAEASWAQASVALEA